MSYRKIIFQREDLYKKVWEKALVQVAADYGLSDNGLKKICIKMNIPIPYSGYWAKLKHGKDVFQTPLPNLKPGDLNDYKMETETIEENILQEKYKNLIEMEEKLENKILVKDRIIKEHPLVSNARRLLLEGGKDSDGMLRIIRGEALNISVTPNNLNRALRILNTLILELEKRGFIVKASSNYQNRVQTILYFDEVDIEIDLRELMKYSRVKKESSYYNKKVDEYEKKLVPTGVLQFEIKNFWDNGTTRMVRDNKSKKLEDQLNLFIICLYRVVNYDVNRHIEWDKARRISEERERQAQLIIEERKREQERTENLLKLADEWNRIKYISTFLDEMEIAMKEKNLLTEEKKDWLIWARNKMKSMNPINRVVL